MMPTMCTNLQRLLTAALEDLCITDVTINYNVTGIFVTTEFVSLFLYALASWLLFHSFTGILNSCQVKWNL